MNPVEPTVVAQIVISQLADGQLAYTLTGVKNRMHFNSLFYSGEQAFLQRLVEAERQTVSGILQAPPGTKVARVG